MKFQYIGCGADDAPRKIRAYDHDFVLKGEPVEVLDPHAIKKLMGCATFVHEPVLAAPKVEPKEAPKADKDSEDNWDVVDPVVTKIKQEKPKKAANPAKTKKAANQ